MYRNADTTGSEKGVPVHFVSNVLFWLGIAELAYLTIGSTIGHVLLARQGIVAEIKTGFVALCALTLLGAAVARYLGY
ncbi:MAG TPA: hypothetical protein VD862_04165 [Candidatus Paceibacterota bacterium]|nr:hypothetical protein [Candidatus Paceibacterota bacterium]